ncbi:MAG TPA: hypothetical protein VEX86_21860 [Longimicrobium sp.]|nr:hypothetical protein [Longimicrobium sp.]
MNMRIDTLALAAILGGGAILGRPAPASATYMDPWKGGELGITYCCVTGPTRCCYLNAGCATKEGHCVRIAPAGG